MGVPDTDIIEIPAGLSSGEIMDTLRDGHDYTWRVMVREPKLVAWGSVRHGNMPEIILVGRRMMLADNEGNTERLRDLMDLLVRGKK